MLEACRLASHLEVSSSVELLHGTNPAGVDLMKVWGLSFGLRVEMYSNKLHLLAVGNLGSGTWCLEFRHARNQGTPEAGAWLAAANFELS